MNKQTMTILIVALVLVVALLIFENPFKGEKPPRWREEEKVQLFTPINEEECSQIEISTMGTTTTLLQKDHVWFTQDGYKADPDGISQLFRVFSALGEPELISINPDAFMKFQVDPMLGTRVRMVDTEGKARVDLIIGQIQRDFFHTPVRQSDSNKVFRVRAILQGMVRRSSWRDDNILRLDPATVQRVAVQQPDDSYVLVRETPGSSWHFIEPTSAPANTEMVQSWVQRIARMRASDFVHASSPQMLTTFGLTTPRARLSISLDNGSSYTVIVGNQHPATKQYWTKRVDDPQVYSIDQGIYADSLPRSANLKPKTEVPPPTEQPTSPTIIRPTTGTVRAAVPPKPSTGPSSPSAALKRMPPKPKPTSTPRIGPTPRKAPVVPPGGPKVAPKPTAKPPGVGPMQPKPTPMPVPVGLPIESLDERQRKN